MDIRALRVLNAVIATGTVTEAAHLIGRTQPQVSRIVMDLEDEIGFPLFERVGRSLVPTPRGLLFAKEAREIVVRMAHIESVAQTLREERSTLVRIAATPHVSHGLIPRTIARVAQISPETEFSITTLKRNTDTGRWEPPGPFDVCLSIIPFLERGMTVEEPFACISAALVAPQGHPLSKLAVVTPADIAPHPYIALRAATPLRRKLDQVFDAHGVAPRIRATAADAHSACELVALGVGVTVCEPLAAAAAGHQTLAMRPFTPTISAQFGASYPSGLPRSCATKIVVNVAQTVIYEMARDFAAPLSVQAPSGLAPFPGDGGDRFWFSRAQQPTLSRVGA